MQKAETRRLGDTVSNSSRQVVHTGTEAKIGTCSQVSGGELVVAAVPGTRVQTGESAVTSKTAGKWQ